ncbi:metallophosphoesterase family protein [Brevibacillus migulae]|uniref:metallophosphoesterase family protein n=1 Tax=Brevibacillus migulae TaxID=1644114 RepID=UPI00106E7732|nr:metallophosphoesterase family protein [Brevibacillus migulae]
MSHTRIAFISDVHGNSFALKAVLADMQTRSITQLVNLGDALYGPIDPKVTAEMLQATGAIHIRGNQDRVLLEADEHPSDTMQFVKGQLDTADIDWLKSMPSTHVLLDEIFLCHGTPSSDETYLTETILPQGVFLRSADAIAADLLQVGQAVIVCGHSHIPRTCYLPDGKLVINPGSVGLPAYEDELPFPHRMESGNPHAKYCILSKEAKMWKVEHITVPYDWEEASRLATLRNRPDWAIALRTGRM